MGLIKAAAGAFGGTMADQWKEFFYCDAIDKDVLVVKGEKRVGGRSSNVQVDVHLIQKEMKMSLQMDLELRLQMVSV